MSDRLVVGRVVDLDEGRVVQAFEHRGKVLNAQRAERRVIDAAYAYKQASREGRGATEALVTLAEAAEQLE